MPQAAYKPYEDLRSLQGVSIPAFSPTQSPVKLLSGASGFITHLVALNVSYLLDTAVQTTRLIFLQLFDASDEMIIGSDASAAISTLNITPVPDNRVSFGVGFFGAQSGSGDGINFQYTTLGILDVYIPDGWYYSLAQSGFGATDKVVGGNALVEYLDYKGDFSGGPSQIPGNTASALAFYLNQP